MSEWKKERWIVKYKGQDYNLHLKIQERFRLEKDRWRDLKTGQFISFNKILKISSQYKYWEKMKNIARHKNKPIKRVRKLYKKLIRLKPSQEKEEIRRELFGTP